MPSTTAGRWPFGLFACGFGFEDSVPLTCPGFGLVGCGAEDSVPPTTGGTTAGGAVVSDGSGLAGGVEDVSQSSGTSLNVCSGKVHVCFSLSNS